MLLFRVQHYDIDSLAIQAGMPMVVEGESVMRCSPRGSGPRGAGPLSKKRVSHENHPDLGAVQHVVGFRGHHGRV